MSRSRTLSVRVRRLRMCRPWRMQRFARWAWRALLLAATYYAGAQLGFALTFPSSPLSIIWPPNAVVFVVLLLVPVRLWWFVLLAVAPAHMLVAWQNGLPATTTLGLYATNCAEAVLAAAIVRRFAGGPPWLVSLRQTVVYVAGAVVVAPLVTSFLDVGVDVLTGWGKDYWLLWQERLLSDALTFLTVPPALLVATSLGSRRLRRIPPLRALEAVLYALGICAASIFVFGPFGPGPVVEPTIVYETLPLLLWAALRFGVGGTSAALLAVTLLSAIWSAGHAMPASASSSVADILMLQAQLLAMSVPLLWLAAVIQERTQAQQALRTSEARYRDLVETQTEMICRYRADGTLTFVNDAYCRHFGRPREALIGISFLDLLPAAQAERARARLLQFAEHPGVLIDEHEVQLPDGSVGWQQWTEHAIYDAAGALVEIQAIGRDVTARRRLEQEREEAHAEAERKSEELDRIIETMADGVIVFDAQGHIVRENAAMRRLVGADAAPPDYYQRSLYERMDLFAARDVQGRPLRLDEGPLPRTLLGEVLTGSETIDLRSRTLDGREVVLNLSVAPLRDREGRLAGAVSLFRDITERKQAEEALEQLTARLLQVQDEERRRIARELHDGTAQTLAAIDISLTTLRGLIRGGVRDLDRFERLLADSQALGEQAMREIRTMSYLLHPPRLDEAGLIPAVQWYVQGFSQRSGIRVDLVVPQDLGRLPGPVENAFFRVIQECLTNVHRHSGSASARILLKRTHSAVHLVVADFGKGMIDVTPATTGEAFDDVHALGVGIPGMRQRLRQLGGRLGIRSTGQGTVVMAIVPVHGAADDDARTPVGGLRRRLSEATDAAI